MNPAKRRAIFERFRENNPNPTTELAYSTPFELLVAVVLSAQATDKGVNKATARLFPKANTPAAIAKLGVEGLIALHPLARPLPQQGEERRRAVGDPWCATTRARCRSDREALEALPGVGRKTANVVLNTRVRRAGHRRGHAHLPRRQPHQPRAGEGRRRGRAQLEKFTPDEFKRNAHHWLILHGRYVCIARKPKCPECIIRDLCEYKQKTKGTATD